MKNLPYDRADRVADQVFHVLCEVFCNDVSDPRLKDVTVTRVRMTADLRVARVYFHMNGGAKELQQIALKGFESSKGYLKRRIGEEIKFKFMPEIEFFYDEAIDVTDRIEKLLNQ